MKSKQSKHEGEHERVKGIKTWKIMDGTFLQSQRRFGVEVQGDGINITEVFQESNACK